MKTPKIPDFMKPQGSVPTSMNVGAIAECLKDYGFDAEKSMSVSLFIGQAVAILVANGADADVAVDVTVGLVAWSMLSLELRREPSN